MQGESFGERSLLDNTARTASVVARGRRTVGVDLLVIGKDVYQHHVSEMVKSGTIVYAPSRCVAALRKGAAAGRQRSHVSR